MLIKNKPNSSSSYHPPIPSPPPSPLPRSVLPSPRCWFYIKAAHLHRARREPTLFSESVFCWRLMGADGWKGTRYPAQTSRVQPLLFPACVVRDGRMASLSAICKWAIIIMGRMWTVRQGQAARQDPSMCNILACNYMQVNYINYIYLILLYTIYLIDLMTQQIWL